MRSGGNICRQGLCCDIECIMHSTQLRTAAVTFLMPLCPSVCLSVRMGTNQIVLDGVSFYKTRFWKYVDTVQGWFQSYTNYTYVIWITVYEGGLKISRPKNEKNECIISKLFLFFNIISLKTNTFIPAMLQRHYPVPAVVLRKICKIPLYSCNRLLFRRKTLTSEEDFEFWEEREIRGSQIWGIG